MTSQTAVRLATMGRANRTSGSSQSVRTCATVKLSANRNGVAAAANISLSGARADTHIATSVKISVTSTPHDGVTTASVTYVSASSSLASALERCHGESPALARWSICANVLVMGASG